MQAINGDITSIQQVITDIVEACNQADKNNTQTDTETDLPVLAQTLSSMMDVMQRVECDTDDISADDVTEVGDYAIHLIDTLAAAAEQLGLQEQKESIVNLFLNVGLWISHQRGLINTLEPVVDAIAVSANNSRSIAALETLNDIILQIIDTVPAVISQDLETSNPGRPWRVLLLNHCIVATRSHNPALMEAAFAGLTDKLPADAPQFFSEGIQQMDTLNYPDEVRSVMEKYHRKWNTDHALH